MIAYSNNINSVDLLNSSKSVKGLAGAVDTRINDLSSIIEDVSESSRLKKINFYKKNYIIYTIFFEILTRIVHFRKD